MIALCTRGSAVRTCNSQNRTLEKVLLIYLLPRNNAIFNLLKTNERADGSQKQYNDSLVLIFHEARTSDECANDLYFMANILNDDWRDELPYCACD